MELPRDLQDLIAQHHSADARQARDNDREEFLGEFAGVARQMADLYLDFRDAGIDKAIAVDIVFRAVDVVVRNGEQGQIVLVDDQA